MIAETVISSTSHARSVPGNTHSLSPYLKGKGEEVEGEKEDDDNDVFVVCVKSAGENQGGVARSHAHSETRQQGGTDLVASQRSYVKAKTEQNGEREKEKNGFITASVSASSPHTHTRDDVDDTISVSTSLQCHMTLGLINTNP